MKRQNGSIGHLLLTDIFPLDCIPGLFDKLADKMPGGPAITVPERMDCVQFAEIMRSPFAYRVGLLAPQIVFILQLAQQLPGRLLDVLMVSESGRSFGNIHSPGLARPLV